MTESYGTVPDHLKGHGNSIIYVSAFLTTIAILVVFGRLYLRLAVQKNFDLSDLFMALGLCFVTAYNILAPYAVVIKGLDWHVQYLDSSMVVTILKYTFALVFLALWSTYVIKMSILLFYRRIARHHFNQVFIHTLHAVGIILTLQFVASLISLFLVCRPMEAFWMSADPAWDMEHDFTCINRGAYIISFGVINVILDIVLTILPTAMIHKIQLPRPQKLALWILFSIGIISSIAAILRMYTSYVDFVTERGKQDPTYYSYGIYLWTAVEWPIAMICASAPTLKALFQHFFGKNSKLRVSDRGEKPTSFGGKKPAPQSQKASVWSMASQSRHAASGSRQNHEEVVADEQLALEIRHLQLRDKGWGPYSTTFEVDETSSGNSSHGDVRWSKLDVGGSDSELRRSAEKSFKHDTKATDSHYTTTELGKAVTVVTTTEHRDETPPVPQHALPMSLQSTSPFSDPPMSPRLANPASKSWHFELRTTDTRDSLEEHTAREMARPVSARLSTTLSSRSNHNSVVLNPVEWRTSNSPAESETSNTQV